MLLQQFWSMLQYIDSSKNFFKNCFVKNKGRWIGSLFKIKFNLRSILLWICGQNSSWSSLVERKLAIIHLSTACNSQWFLDARQKLEKVIHPIFPTHPCQHSLWKENRTIGKPTILTKALTVTFRLIQQSQNYLIRLARVLHNIKS